VTDGWRAGTHAHPARGILGVVPHGEEAALLVEPGLHPRQLRHPLQHLPVHGRRADCAAPRHAHVTVLQAIVNAAQIGSYVARAMRAAEHDAQTGAGPTCQGRRARPQVCGHGRRWRRGHLCCSTGSEGEQQRCG